MRPVWPYRLPGAGRAAWRHVAERLADRPAVIGFDVLNEPNWGSYPIFELEPDRLAPLYNDVVLAVREAAPSWVAFLEPSASRNLGFATTLPVPAFPDVMYAPHSYDAMAENGGGFDPARRQAILDYVGEIAAEAKQLGAGLWIGEYGGNADSAGIVDYMTAEYDAAGAVAGSTMYWAYDKSGGYGLLDPDGNEKPALLGALVRPYPERVAGTPIDYRFDATTSTFTASYTADRAVTAPTIIVVPDRLYPSGYTVECDGCALETSANQLTITTPPRSSPSTIVIH